MTGRKNWLLAAALLSLAAVMMVAWSAATPLFAQQPDAAKGASAQIEARIRDLHDKLKVTEAQAGQWEAVARTLRTNAQAIAQLNADRRTKAPAMTAVDEIRLSQEVIETEAKGAKRLGDVFEKLYDTLTLEQKSLADSLFRQHRAEELLTR